MANGGGRGWFQRRKPRPDPAPSAPPEPEPTRIEAYEAQRGEARTTEFMPGAHTATAAPRRDFDELVDPGRNRTVDADQAHTGADDRRWAPPQDAPDQSAGPRDPLTSPVERGRDRSADSEPAGDEQVWVGGSGEVRPEGSPLVAPETRPAARYDWDAATAAALSDDGAPSGAPAGESLPRSEPDRLLEEIIREIVGDATAETVSSLQPPPRAPSIHTESPVERTPVPAPPGEVPAVAEERPGAMSESRSGPAADRSAEPPGAGPTPTPGSSDGRAAEDRSADAPAPSTSVDGDDEANQPSAESADVEYPSQGAQLPAATSVADEPADAELTDGPGTADVSPQTSPIRENIASSMTDVSRETRDADGGTPLADQIADETRRRLALDEAVLPLPPSTRVFTISNQKGGVGKTTSAVNLAAALARAGAHVLVIDLDPQGNASTALGVDHRSERQSVYEVLVSDLALSEVIQQSTEHERLDCVPATIHLAGAEIELVSLVAREQRLRRALDAHLATMERPYDYVFIDCPPSLGLLTINAFVAAREVLIPIQCEYYALEGLSQLLSNIELIEKHLNPELRLSTILLTMYDSRTNLAQQVAQEVRDHFPTQTLDTIIPRSVRVSEAPSYGQSVISYDFASSGSLSYREAAAEIARRGTSETKETN